MDACCHFGTLSRGGFVNGDNGFWGEKIRGSLNNGWMNQWEKSLNLEKKERKIKPGVAYSVLTRENIQETLVSLFAPQFMLIHSS